MSLEVFSKRVLTRPELARRRFTDHCNVRAQRSFPGAAPEFPSWIKLRE